MNTKSPFFLFISATEEAGATDRLKASETLYRRKRLESSPENWRRTIEILGDPDLHGVLVKLTSKTCELLADSTYGVVAPDLLAAISAKPNIVFIHEAVLSDVIDESALAEPVDVDSSTDLPEDEPLRTGVDFLLDADPYSSFAPISMGTRDKVREMMVDYDLNLVPYVTNAQLSVLASQFIEEADKRLLFRIYVPVDRLWAKEAEKLLSLFSDWLTKAKGQTIRQGGYRTGRGAVYEFYSDDESLVENLSSELQQFSDFLDLCMHDPDAAASLLAPNSPNLAVIGGVVARYSAEARRLQLDLKFERDQKLLNIRYRLQSELMEDPASSTGALALADRLVPSPASLAAILHPVSLVSEGRPSQPPIIVNNQIIGTVHGIVTQELSGTVNLGPEPTRLLELISRFGGAGQAELESAVLELGDAGAKPVERLAAGQKIKGFLIKIGNKLSGPAIEMLQKYIESSLGM